MNSRTAARRCGSPRSTIRSKHSDLADPTNLSANAFKLGLHAGRTSGFTPLSRSSRRNAAVYSGSRSRMMYCNPRRNPSLESVRFLASCVIHASSGSDVIPAISNRAGLQFRDEEDRVAHEAAQGQHFHGEEVGRGEAL